MPDRALIINADDLGYDPAVNEGIFTAMRNGVVSSATLIVNSPHSQDAAGKAEDEAIGLHLNLARFAPVWTGFPAELLQANQLSEALAPKLSSEVVEKETLAQLDRFESLLGRPPTHIDVHKHLHTNASVLEGVRAAAAARSLPVRAINELMRRALRSGGLKTPDHFIGDVGSQAFWTLARLRQALEQLPTGVTELMCHPGFAPTMMRSGYAVQREVELETFIHPSARSLLDRFEISVADFTLFSRLHSS